MGSERKIFFRDIGEIMIRKRRNIKRLSIRIDRNGGVSMTVPYLLSYRDAERFLDEKIDWVKETRERIITSAPPKTIYSEGEIMLTKFHCIRVERDGVEVPEFKVHKDHTLVRLPPVCDIRDEAIQEFIKVAITETLRAEAKSYLIPRVRELSEEHGFRINRVMVKNHKSRWGSCSSRNNINLNLHLMRLPVHLADYVILHELVHTVHRNHSPAFWNMLAEHVSDPRGLAREMRKYQTIIP